MASVRHLVTPPGKGPVEFYAPADASDGQLQQLASAALAAKYPSESFVTPVLDPGTRKSLERAPAKLTQDEILAQQGDLEAPEPSLRDAAVDRIRETMMGWGMDPHVAQREAESITGALEFLPGPGTATAADDARVAATEGRYGAAAGDAAMAGLDLLPGVGKGASVLAMFLGRHAKTANLGMLRKAEQMAEQGANPGQILRDTGWFKQHGDWKYEISDQPLKLNMENLPKFGEKVPLRNVVSHPELEAAYPEAFAAAKFRKETDPVYGGSWNDGDQTLKAKYYSDQQMRSITAHELQHFVQGQEGFAKGGIVPRAEPDLTDPEYLALKPEWERLSAEYNRLRTPGPDYDLEASDAIGDQVEDVWSQMELASNKPRYMDVAGEVEARNVQARLRGSGDQRRLRAPWSTQEVPDHLQVVTRRDGIAYAPEDAPLSADPPGTVPTESALRLLLDDIEHGESAMPGGKLTWPGSDDLVRDYAGRETDFPPIEVLRNDDGTYMVTDGSHRLEAARLRGDKDISATILGEDAPLSADPPGTVPVENVLKGVAPKKSAALANVFEGVEDYDTALRMAGEGAHIRLTPDGYLMGSPGLKPEDLAAWRAGIDQKMLGANREGYGWYDKVRMAIAGASETPEQAQLLARTGAAYSPKTNPIDETNRAIDLHNNMVLTGDSPSIGMPAQFSAARKGYTGVGDEGYVTFDPQAINLGPKTEPYGTSKDPTAPLGWRAVNDGWHGTFMGYSDDTTKMYDQAFQPNQHAFLQGENVLATERARASGALPPEAMPENFQETAWVDVRKNAWLEIEQKRFEAGDRKTPPTEQEALAYALQGVDAGLARNTASVSREFTPGGGLGELENIGQNQALNEQFSTAMRGVEGERPASLSATQMYSFPSVPGIGYWNDPVHGMQINPNITDQPVVALRPEKYLDKKGKEVTGGMAMSGRDKSALSLIAKLHGLENMQHGVGANIFVPANTSHRADQINGLRFPAEQRTQIQERAAAAGLDVVDNVDGGIIVTKFSDFGDAKERERVAKEVKAFGEKTPGGTRGRFDTNYVRSGLSDWDDVAVPQGEGIATRELLEEADKLPLVEQRLTNSKYPDEVAQRNAIREKLAAETGQPLREDAQRLRGLLAKGGVAAVRDWVAKNGYKGLPIWIAGILGLRAATSPGSSEPGA